MSKKRRSEEGKIKKQFWSGFGFFLVVAALLILVFASFVLSSLNFFE